MICLRYKLLFEICAKLRKNKAVFSHRIFYGCIRNKKVFARLGKILHDLERGVFRDVSWFFTFCSYAVFTLKLSKGEKKKKNFVQMENITFRRYNKTTKTWTACKLLFQYLMIELSSFDFNLSWKKCNQLGSFVFKISIFFVDTTILLAKEKRNLHFWTNISNKLRSKWLHSIQLADNANFTPLNFLIYLENFLNIKSIKKWR